MADGLPTKTLLVVGESFFPDNTPRANRWSYFCRELDRRGWSIRVISSHFDGVPLATALSRPTPVRSAPSLIVRACRRAFSMLVFEHEIFWSMRRLASFARNIKIYKDVDLVLAYGLPFSGIVLGSVCARWLGRPLIAEYGDPIDLNPARKPPLLERFANRWIMKRATRVIVTNNNYAEFATQIHRRHVECLAPVASLPAPSEDDLQIREQFAHLGKGMKAFYAGMFYDGIRSGVPFVEALERLDGEVTFVHAGARYRKADGRAQYCNIGYLDQRLVPRYLYWTDFALYFTNDSVFQTPSKIVEVAHMARVVLAIGSGFTDFERKLLLQTETVFVENNSSAIEASFATLARICKSDRKSKSDLDARITRLAEYNTGVLSRLERILRDTCKPQPDRGCGGASDQSASRC